MNFACEIPLQLLIQLRKMRVFTWDDRAGKHLLQRVELRFQSLTIGELEQTNATIVRRRDQRSQRTFHPRNDDAIQIMTCARRTTKRARKCVTKSAVRLV